jgi:hypothetical protein
MVTPVTITLTVVTKNITPINMSSYNDNKLLSKRLPACLGGLICGGLLLLAVPRFISAIYAMYPQAAYNLTENILPLTVYENSISDLKSALFWHKQADYWQSLGYFYKQLVRAQPSLPEEQKLIQLKKAQTAIIEGLALSPVDPFAWYQLAIIDNRLNVNKQVIINALCLSFYAGRVEPELVIPRLLFGYNFYNDFSEEMKLLWQKQIKVAWLFKPPQVINFVLLHPEAKQLVLNAFINTPDEANQFISLLASQSWKK